MAGKKLGDMSLEELWQLFPIILCEHNPDYRQWYLETKQQLVLLLQDFSIARISHIGSTAVPGLLAKPIVDILLELPSGYRAEELLRALVNNGWILMCQDTAKQTMSLNKGYTPEGFAERVFHLHVRPAGDWDEFYFRDYLIEHQQAAAEYEALKRMLKEKYRHNRDAYTEAKTEFVRACTEEARCELGNRYVWADGDSVRQSALD